MKIAEIFESLQGEGKNQGRPCLFIRFAGCNLSCRWCDTAYAQQGGTETGCKEVLEQCWRKNPHLVCITGGEPLFQKDALLDLLPSISMDVKCPSSGETSDLALLAAIRPRDCVKFVVRDEEDCRYAQDVLEHHPITGEIFFSPVYGADYGPIIRYILDNDLPVRFQLQLHKVIGVR